MSKPCLILDFDGVIVDSMEKTHKNMNLACKAAGIKKEFSEKEFLIFSEKNFFEAMVDEGFTHDDLIKINESWMSLMRHDLAKMLPITGIKSLLDKIKPDYKIFLVTSNFKNVIQPFFDNNKFHYFEDILDAGHEKSKVKKIIKIINNNTKSKVIFVSDTKGDILEGKDAGAICIGVSWGYHNKEKLLEATPDYVFDKIKDLETFLLEFSNEDTKKLL